MIEALLTAKATLFPLFIGGVCILSGVLSTAKAAEAYGSINYVFIAERSGELFRCYVESFTDESIAEESEQLDEAILTSLTGSEKEGYIEHSPDSQCATLIYRREIIRQLEYRVPTQGEN